VNETDGARVRILDAAEGLFADDGFDATPTSSIAKLAGVPKGLLFYYFPTKSDVLRALVAERLDLGPIDTTELIEPGDPARALMNLARKLSEIESGSPVLRVIVWREQRTHPEVRAKLNEHRAQMQGVVEGVLRGSLLKPIATRTIRAAAAAWVAILAIRPFADHADPATDDAAPDLRALADLICGGLGGAALA
jgi:AcrR family transcriptional regulator